MKTPAESTTESTNDDDVDEQFRSLMEGLRTSLPAVQVLFAFLLTAPLQGAFADLNSPPRIAFSVAFYSSGLASVLLVAPSVHQRVRAPISGVRRESRRHLMWATWLGIAGSVVMAVAVAATIFLVSSLVFAESVAVVASATMTFVLTCSWFYMPLVTFRRRSR